jgi:hypothetical protein
LQLLAEFGVSPGDWQDLQYLLEEDDPEVVIVAATIGLRVTQKDEHHRIFDALFRVSKHINWVQEDVITTLLESDRELASNLARAIEDWHRAHGENPDWLDPSWRILRHALKQGPH